MQIHRQHHRPHVALTLQENWTKPFPHLGGLQQVRVHGRLHRPHARLAPEVVRAQEREVVVREGLVEREDQVDERLAAAHKGGDLQ